MKLLNRLVAGLLLATLSITAFAITDAQLFTWAAANYPQYFPGTSTAGQYQQYNYRFYPSTGNYLGVDPLGNVFVLGTPFGQGIRNMGSLQGYSDTVTAWVARPLATGFGTVRVSGTVSDQNGNPVAGVTIKVFSHNSHVTVTTTTNANGAYTIAGLDKNNNSNYTAENVIYAEKAGLGFYPSTTDGTITRFDFDSFYRTVIRFFPMPQHDISGANFIASRAGDKLTNLPRTGQTTSYASGDDAAAARGVAWPSLRFTDNNDGTVTDNLTGLIWLKDAGCLGASQWATELLAADQLASGACGLSDGSSAGQWRLPNVNELESLVDVSRSNPVLAAGHPFTNVANAYWSSTTYMAGRGNAMVIRFTDGRWINGPDSGYDNFKTTASNAGWAVKTGGAGKIKLLATGVYAGIGGGSFGTGDDAGLHLGVPAPQQRFIDNGDGTVADTVTGLTWLKQADCIKQSWSGAMAAVNTMASGQCGLTDGSVAGQWRLPNRSEMLSLSDRAPTFPLADYYSGQLGSDGLTVIRPVVFSNFKTSFYYWTSTTDAADPLQAWTLYSCDFGVFNILKTDTQQYAMAVR